MRTRLAALAAALPLALAACGGGNDEEDVRKSVSGFYDALADKDADKACKSLSEEGRRQITQGSQGKRQSCEELVNFVLLFSGDRLKRLKDARVSDVKVDGDKATARVSLEKQSSRVPLVKEDGDWKVTELQGSGGGN